MKKAKNTLPLSRMLNALLVFFAIAGMLYALYLQYVVQLAPCPLCIFQRIGLIVMGIFALINALVFPKNFMRWILWLGSLLGVLWSFVVAARHVWLQHLPPDQVPSCGPGLEYWVQALPLAQVIKEVFKGSGECAVIDWTLFGLSIPAQGLMFFGALIIIHGIIAYVYKIRII